MFPLILIVLLLTPGLAIAQAPVPFNPTVGTNAQQPGSCSGPGFYIASDVTDGSLFRACQAGVYVPIQASGTPAGSTGNGIFTVVRTSASVLTLGAGCSSALPCSVSFIGIGDCSITSSSTATSSGGSDTAYIYMTSGCTLTVGHNTGSNLTCSAGCTVVTGITAFPVSGISLWSWTRTGGNWDTTGGTNANPGGKPTKIPPITIGCTFSGAGSALTNGTTPGVSLCYLPPLTSSCTTQAWTITVDTGTAGFRVWRKSSGTAVPTVSDTITTGDLAISSGTVLTSTTFTNFTGSTAPVFAAGDNVAVQLNAASSATVATYMLQCQQ